MSSRPTRVRRPRLRSLGALVGAAGLAAGLSLTPLVTAAPGGQLPNLVSDVPEGLYTVEQTIDEAPGMRLLLRFDGHVHNAGPGRLEVLATGRTGSWEAGTLRMADVRQHVYDAGGTLVDELASPIQFTHAGPLAPERHQHWHVDYAASYTLVSAPSLAPVRESAKVGFCFADSERVEAPEDAPARYDGGDCNGLDEYGSPIADPVDTRTADYAIVGISEGFRDNYRARYWTQWIDLTGAVAPGRYAIRAVADPHGVVFETDEANPPAYSPEFTLRGWLPTPRSVPPGAPGSPQVIALGAQKVAGTGLAPGEPTQGEPGPVVYALASPPSHGTVTIAGSTATYTPDPGYAGPDSFTFTASEDGTRLASPPATVTLAVGVPAPSVAGPLAPTRAARPALRGTLRVRGRVATARFTPARSGKLTISVLRRGRLIARCRRITARPGRAVPCRTVLPRGAGVAGLSASAMLVSGGTVVARARVRGA
jgi:hypothetical protein